MIGGHAARTGAEVAVLALLALLPMSAVSAAAPPFADAPVVEDSALDAMRGGFVLPNGMDIALGLEVLTMLNGELAMRTVMTVDQGSTLAVYAGGGAPGERSGQGATVVRFGPVDMEGKGAQVPLTPNGTATNTPMGDIRLQQDDRGAVVVMTGNALELRHMIGTVTGAVIANTANDRVIDTMVTVNLDLRNSDIQTGSALVRLESMLVDAVAATGTR